MLSSYLKLKPACLLKKVKPGRVRQRGFGSGFISRIIGSSALGSAMDMINGFNCIACALPLDRAEFEQAGAAPTLICAAD